MVDCGYAQAALKALQKKYERLRTENDKVQLSFSLSCLSVCLSSKALTYEAYFVRLWWLALIPMSFDEDQDGPLYVCMLIVAVCVYVCICEGG